MIVHSEKSTGRKQRHAELSRVLAATRCVAGLSFPTRHQRPDGVLSEGDKRDSRLLPSAIYGIVKATPCSEASIWDSAQENPW